LDQIILDFLESKVSAAHTTKKRSLTDGETEIKKKKHENSNMGQKI